MPSPDSALHARMPSRVSGTLTTMCGSIFAMSWPCVSMPAKSVAVTSPLTGPFTMSQILFRFWRQSPSSFARSDGLVVTPSRMPSAATASISLMLPVSTKSFIVLPPRGRSIAAILPRRFLLAVRKLARIARLVDRLDGVDVPHARVHFVFVVRLRDWRGHQRRQVGAGPAEYDVTDEVRLAVRIPNEVDDAFARDRLGIGRRPGRKGARRSEE